MKRIGVLTGGGDVPGLNPCIKTIVYRAVDEGYEVVGIRKGWGGLLYCNPEDPQSIAEYIVPLDKQRVRTIDRTGGTFLHTSRTNPGKVRASEVPAFLKDKTHPDDKGPFDFTPHVLQVLDKLGVDTLVPIGGDDTLSYAERLHREGVHIAAIPKTMDNDVYGTDYCIGFSTAITRSVEFIHQLRTSAGSHERIAVVELFGRNSGETCAAGVLSGRASIAPSFPKCISIRRNWRAFLMEDKQKNPSNYAMVTISEGAQMTGGKIIEYGQADAYGHKKLGGIGVITGEALKKITGEDILYQQISYLMRSGAPDSLDLMVAVNYANMAIKLITRGASNRMVALRNGTYTSIPISTIMQGIKRVDVEELYDAENYLPKVRHVEGKPMFLY